MRIQAVNSGVPSHDFAMSFMLEALEARGHEVVRAGFFRDEDSPRVASEMDHDGIDFACTISGLNQVFNESHEEFADPPRPWILYSHGISLHKPYSMGKLGIDFSFYPAAPWVDYLRDYHSDTCVAVSTDGWGKLDALWGMKPARHTTKAEVCWDLELDVAKPLIVFAPSWSRAEWPTWADWQAGPHHNDLYRCAGVEYMADEILGQLARVDANVVYLPHDMGADELKGIGYYPERRVKLLVGCDVLVTDTSSMAAEFLVLDKPIVQIARRPEDRLAGHLHLWHEPTLSPCHLGDPIWELDTLAATVERRLQVDEYAAERAFWLRRCVGFPDGHMAEREAMAVERCVADFRGEPRPHEPGEPPGGHPESEKGT